MLENINTFMYSYTIEYNWNIYQNLVSNYHMDNKDYSGLLLGLVSINMWSNTISSIHCHTSHEAFAPQLHGP